jgi:hypothetical protein
MGAADPPTLIAARHAADKSALHFSAGALNTAPQIYWNNLL